jgi:D-alanyl-D-alanine carboxypeptidase/D-alanyl-D-alanine-endopeptidase (penicillin-binding protein 4)
MAIETLDGESLYSRRSNDLFIPASNQKLLTTAAALTHLGPQARLQTPIYQLPQADRSTVLQIVGQGDPALDYEDLDNLAQQLRRQGITQIDRLIADDSQVHGALVPPSWSERDDLEEGYGAPTNALILNQNAIPLTLWPQQQGQPLYVEWENPRDRPGWQVHNLSHTVAPGAYEYVDLDRELDRPILYVEAALRAGSASEPVAVAVTTPGQHFLQQFTTSLENFGVGVKSQTLIQQPNSTSRGQEGQIIATVASPPLADLIRTANQESQNVYTEALLKWLGRPQTASPGFLPIAPLDLLHGRSSLDLGLATMAKVLVDDLGLDANSFILADGSGLSRENWVTPDAVVTLLQSMARSPYGQTYRDSLALATETGTLENRFHNTLAAKKVWAKTGGLRGVASLSGYLNPPNYEPIAFSILINQSDHGYGTLHRGMDQVVVKLAHLRACSN